MRTRPTWWMSAADRLRAGIGPVSAAPTAPPPPSTSSTSPEVSCMSGGSHSATGRRRVADELGAGQPQNRSRMPADLALALIEAAKAAHSLDGTVTVRLLVPRLDPAVDFGAVPEVRSHSRTPAQLMGSEASAVVATRIRRPHLHTRGGGAGFFGLPPSAIPAQPSDAAPAPTRRLGDHLARCHGPTRDQTRSMQRLVNMRYRHVLEELGVCIGLPADGAARTVAPGYGRGSASRRAGCPSAPAGTG
jgi:hypothetical protein